MDEDKICSIALNSLPYMHPATYHALMERFGGAADVFKAKTNALLEVKEAPPAMVDLIKSTDPSKAGEDEINLAEKLDVRFVFLGGEEYPTSLAAIYRPPPVLTILGELRKEDDYSLAVVGTREPSGYGRAMAERFAGRMADMGFAVVSGFARGIDATAHRAALKAGGRTIAVLGCGLNINYPANHRDLKLKIAQSGAVISQFGLKTDPGKTTFPIRNRVVAGMTYGTLVVEAPVGSGALITAFSALDEGKEVFAVPGPANSKKSEGANKLIQKGHAKLALDVKDVIEELPEKVRNWHKNSQLNLGLEDGEARLELDEEEGLVIKTLESCQRHIDEVAALSRLPLSKVSAILLSLEIKGLVKQSAGKMFMRS